MRTTPSKLLLTLIGILFLHTIKSQTVNYVPKYITTSTFDNSLIFDNGTNLGIGTTSPAYRLDVYDGDIRTKNNLYFRAVGTGNGISADDGAGSTIFSLKRQASNEVRLQGYGFLTFYTNGSTGTERMRIDASGNIGIGTASPGAQLHLASNSDHELRISRTNGQYGFRIFRDATAGNIQMQIGTNTTPTWETKIQIGEGEGANTKLLLNPNGGNVGIGSTSATYKLDVRAVASTKASYFQTTGDWQAIDFSSDGGTTKGSLSATGSKLTIGSSASGTNPFLTINLTSGNVGIGTTTPSAKLHVNNGSILANGTTGATPTSGAGPRMMWIPTKIAFRAGDPNSTVWDDANIGYYSVAFGLNTQASGQRSFALGEHTVASGSHSIATGLANNSTGYCATTFGSNNNATGNFSSAFGYNTTTSGLYSMSTGNNLTAQSYSSFVIGQYNIISGTSGSWLATDPLFVIGNGTGTSARSNAVTVLKNGNVGIGTALVNNPNSYKLAVNGTIGAKAVKVELNSTTWPDFVFNKDYKLRNLKEVEEYVQQNQHLPEVPTAKEIERNGADLGELLRLQMQKIEELTLYIIEQNKRIETLEKNDK